MADRTFKQRIGESVDKEIDAAQSLVLADEPARAFHHLERAHVLGQSITYEHARVHWQMLKIGWKIRNWREIFGQVFRIAGASTKTPLGIYPNGNTGGSNVYFFQPMPVPKDLQAILDEKRTN